MTDEYPNTSPIELYKEKELEERGASWLELFYDLAFVAGIAQLTYFLANYVETMGQFAQFVFMTFVFYSVWRRVVINSNLFPNETLVSRFLVQGSLAFVLLASIFVVSAFEGGYVGFALGIAGVKILSCLSLEYGYRRDVRFKNFDKSLHYGFSIAAGMWLISAFLAFEYALLVWLLASVLEIAAPQIKTENEGIVRLNKNHMAERLGLFTMLVLGESLIVVALVNQLASISSSSKTIFLFGILFVLLTAIWWLYFEVNEHYLKGKRFPSLLWVIEAHGFITIGIMMIAAGAKALIDEVTGTSLLGELYIVTGLMLVVAAVTAIRYALGTSLTAMRINIAFVCSVPLILLVPISSLIFASVISILFVVFVVYHVKHINV